MANYDGEWLAMIDGWPITHHVFRGNLQDQQSVLKVIIDVEEPPPEGVEKKSGSGGELLLPEAVPA